MRTGYYVQENKPALKNFKKLMKSQMFGKHRVYNVNVVKMLFM